MSSKSIFIMTFCLICVAACESKNDFPKDLIGKWNFDVDAARNAINEGPWTNDEKKELEKTYLSIVQDQSMEITQQGEFQTLGQPESVRLQLEVLKTRKNSYVIKTINPLNPDLPQYSEFKVGRGSIRVVLLDENFVPIKGVPDDFWKR